VSFGASGRFVNRALRSIGCFRRIVLLQELDRVAVTQVGRNRGVMAHLLGDLVAKRFHQNPVCQMEAQPREFPAVVSYVGLFEEYRATFAQFAEDAESEVDVGDEVGIEAHESLLRLVHPDLTGDTAQDVCLNIRRIELGIGLEDEPIALSRSAGNHVLKLVEERIRQKAKDMVDAAGIFLLALAAVLLQLGVLGEIVEALEFGLVEVGADGLAVDGDQAGDVAIFGFDNEFGGVVALVDLADEVLSGPMGLVGVQPMLDGAADQGGRVEHDGRTVLGGCGSAGNGSKTDEGDGCASHREANPGEREMLFG